MDSCLPCSPEQRNNGGRWYVRMLVLAHLQSTNRAQIAFVALGTCEQRTRADSVNWYWRSYLTSSGSADGYTSVCLCSNVFVTLFNNRSRRCAIDTH